jgi:hypothetical protein
MNTTRTIALSLVLAVCALAPAAALAGLWPLARGLARRRTVT